MEKRVVFEKICEVLALQAGLLKEMAVLIKKLEENGENEEYLMPIKEAARRLGLAESTLRRLIAQKEIKSVRVGGKIVVPSSEITRLSRSN